MPPSFYSWLSSSHLKGRPETSDAHPLERVLHGGLPVSAAPADGQQTLSNELRGVEAVLACGVFLETVRLLREGKEVYYAVDRDGEVPLLLLFCKGPPRSGREEAEHLVPLLEPVHEKDAREYGLVGAKRQRRGFYRHVHQPVVVPVHLLEELLGKLPDALVGHRVVAHLPVDVPEAPRREGPDHHLGYEVVMRYGIGGKGAQVG